MIQTEIEMKNQKEFQVRGTYISYAIDIEYFLYEICSSCCNDNIKKKKKVNTLFCTSNKGGTMGAKIKFFKNCIKEFNENFYTTNSYLIERIEKELLHYRNKYTHTQIDNIEFDNGNTSKIIFKIIAETGQIETVSQSYEEIALKFEDLKKIIIELNQMHQQVNNFI